jgi:hypothetical protein
MIFLPLDPVLVQPCPYRSFFETDQVAAVVDEAIVAQVQALQLTGSAEKLSIVQFIASV